MWDTNTFSLSSLLTLDLLFLNSLYVVNVCQLTPTRVSSIIFCSDLCVLRWAALHQHTGSVKQSSSHHFCICSLIFPRLWSRSAVYFLFSQLKCLISNHTSFPPPIYLQGSRDHPGLALLWGHWHVVLGLCDSWALPRLAPLPGGLRVWSGNTISLFFLKDPTSIPMNHTPLCAVMFMHLHSCALFPWACSGG